MGLIPVSEQLAILAAGGRMSLTGLRPMKDESTKKPVIDQRIIQKASDSVAPRIREFTSKMAQEIGAKVEAEFSKP